VINLSVFRESIWIFLKKREKEIEETINVIDDVEFILQEMWFSGALMEKLFLRYIPKVSSEILINTLYFRNVTYLTSSYQLAKIGFIMPSHNLQRTVLESLVKGYLYIVEEDLSDMHFIVTMLDKKLDSVEKDILKSIIIKNVLPEKYIICANNLLSNKIPKKELKKKVINRIKKYSNFNKNIGLLYKKSRVNKYRDIYRKISTTAHPSSFGVITDLTYNKIGIINSLELILLFSYANMQMFLEQYYPQIRSQELLKLFKDSMNHIINTLNQVSNIEPNKQIYNEKIRFKTANFNDIL